MKHSRWTSLLYLPLLVLFAYTAGSKILSRQAFADVLWQAPLIGPGADAVAWAVPLTEIAVVLLLLFPATRLAGLVASLALLLVFTGYIALMLLGNYHLPCQCGGVVSRLSWPQHLFFNLFFLGLNWWAIRGAMTERFRRTHEGALPDG